MKKILTVCLILVGSFVLVGCERDARIASQNLSKQADMFELERRVVFYNGINGEYMLTIQGKCAIVDSGAKLEVTCMTGEEQFKKHYLGLSDNVTYFVEQMDAKKVNRYHYEVVFKPQTIVPDIDFRGSTKAMGSPLMFDDKD